MAIEELESKRGAYEILKNDERLIGILLGYGKESANAFYEAIHSQKGVPLHTNIYCPVEVPRSNGCTLFPIVIMGNPYSSEVKSLISVYERELREFWEIYQKQDSLELFLRCICTDGTGSQFNQ